jgi:hypothetical protein
MMPVFWNESGRPFRVRLVREGERYGRDDGIVHDAGDPLVEFYDASQDPAKFGERGQFVTRYYASTLLHDDGNAVVPDWRRHCHAGLALDEGVAGWRVDGVVMTQVYRWLASLGFDAAWAAGRGR